MVAFPKQCCQQKPDGHDYFVCGFHAEDWNGAFVSHTAFKNRRSKLKLYLSRVAWEVPGTLLAFTDGFATQ
jgi:hypothetical protein